MGKSPFLLNLHPVSLLCYRNCPYVRFTEIAKQSINAYFDKNVITKGNAIPDHNEQSRHIGLDINGRIKKNQ